MADRIQRRRRRFHACVRMRRPASWVLAMCLLAACKSTRLPDGQGQGIVAFDREAPAGAPTWSGPVWRVGDRFVLTRGGALRLAYRVLEAGPDEYVLGAEDGNLLLRFGMGLTQIGEEQRGDPRRVLMNCPPDTPCLWPLWVGKRWTTEVLKKSPGQPAMSLLLAYHCDRLEEVQVRAGTFQCLRIWRHARLLGADEYLTSTSVSWYSPDAGFFVRQLEDGVLTELAEYHRQ